MLCFCGGCFLGLVGCFVVVVMIVNSVVVLRFFAAGVDICITFIDLDCLVRVC